MDARQWIDIYKEAFRAIDDRLEQVVTLSGCREHWIQAELSLYAWERYGLEVWTEVNIGERRKADLYFLDDQDQQGMITEVKCLGDWALKKTLRGKWSVQSDIQRMEAAEGWPARIFILIIPHGPVATAIGDELRQFEWAGPGETLDIKTGLVRFWDLSQATG